MPAPNKFYFLFLSLCCAMLSSQASHLVVGEMSYKHLGSNNYEVTLTYYRDCINGSPNAILQDAPASISIYKGQNLVTIDSNIQASSQQILPTINPNSCLNAAQFNTCINKLVFKRTFNLPPSIEGYTIINQRCCMSSAISNVSNAGNVGHSFYCKIPPSSTPPSPMGYNNSAEFLPAENTTYCVNKKYEVNTSATDVDGDSLSYAFDLIENGGSASNPKPSFLGSSLPNFTKLNYTSPFTISNPMPGISINSKTGKITLTPTMQGSFAFCVACYEWRNGVIINTVRRTYVYSVYDCQFDVSANIKCNQNLYDASNGNLCLANCESKTISFKNNSVGALAYYWDFGVNGTASDTSNAFEPSFTYTDTGLYRVVLYAYGANCTDSIVQYISISEDELYADFLCTGQFCTGKEIQCTSNSISTQDVISYWKWTVAHVNEAFVSKEQNPIMTLNQGGYYTVTLQVFNSKGCSATKDSAINLSTLNVQAYDDALVFKGSSVPLNATGADSMHWSIATNNAFLNNSIGPNTTVTTTNAGNVKVYVVGTNNDGCQGSDTVNIQVVDNTLVFVPTAFTPNGDNLNDVLHIKLVGAQLDFFRVYNRRGQQVFETKDINQGWDGRLNGGELGIDTYYWMASLIGQSKTNQSIADRNSKTIVKGDVILVR